MEIGLALHSRHVLKGACMLDSLAKKVAPQHTAVLVVDMRNEFVEEGGLRGREGDDLSQRVRWYRV
jgi:hypothetical protein